MRSRLSLILSMMVVGCVVSGCQQREDRGDQVEKSPATRVEESGKTGLATLEIEINSEREKRVHQVSSSETSTVFSILETARATGDLEFVSVGAGETVFVKSIDSVKNEGANGNNWFYLVNLEPGDRSCGAFLVKPGDHILWVHGDYP